MRLSWPRLWAPNKSLDRRLVSHKSLYCLAGCPDSKWVKQCRGPSSCLRGFKSRAQRAGHTWSRGGWPVCRSVRPRGDGAWGMSPWVSRRSRATPPSQSRGLPFPQGSLLLECEFPFLKCWERWGSAEEGGGRRGKVLRFCKSSTPQETFQHFSA